MSVLTKMKIYDPRLGKKFTIDPAVGPPWFGPNHHTLAVEFSPGHPAAVSHDCWVDFLAQFKCERLSLHINMIGRWGKFRKKLQTNLGKKTSRKSQYFATFDHSDQVTNDIIKNYIQLGTFEEWIVGGFHSRNTSDVEDMKFQFISEREDFFRDIQLFDFILSFDLDWHDAKVICTKTEWFDDMITFFIDRYPLRSG